MVVLALDEAHVLCADRGGWTNLGEFRRALRSLAYGRVFTLFLSTTGDISQFVPSKHEDPSMRVVKGELQLIKPFTDLDFDLFAPNCAQNMSLNDAAKEEFMVQFGRPL